MSTISADLQNLIEEVHDGVEGAKDRLRVAIERLEDDREMLQQLHQRDLRHKLGLEARIERWEKVTGYLLEDLEKADKESPGSCVVCGDYR